jgi:hypothetical protein
MDPVSQIPDPIFDPIAQSAVAAFVRESLWAYPLLETLHVIGLALVFGPILLFDLRVLGWNKDLSVSRLHKALLPWVWTGFAINASSGILLFVSDAAEFAANTSLRFKMALLVLAGLNALYFQSRIAPGVPAWDRETNAPTPAGASAALSIALWLAIITAGRMIAYIK